MRPTKLSAEERNAALAGLEGWALDGDVVTKEFDCGSFPAAVAFVVRIGFLAEQVDHHPDLDVRYRRVTVALTTHDAGGLTVLDFDLAHAIDRVATRPPQ